MSIVNKSDFLQRLLIEDNKIENLINCIEHPFYGTEVIMELIELKDRRAILPLIQLAKKNGKNKNAIQIYALSTFNCEEFIEDIIKLGINADFESRTQIVDILFRINVISKETKENILDFLKSQNLSSNEDIEFKNYCIDVINAIPLIGKIQSAKILILKKEK